MRCTTIRNALSARLDGEAAEVPDIQLETHLAGCGTCRAWAAAAVEVTREVRLSPVAPVPDLTVSVLAALGPPTRRRRSVGGVRVALLLVGVLQVVVALRLLGIGDGDVASHVARETAMWEVALGVGFVVAGALPSLARGMAPLVAVFCVAAVGVAATDLAYGHTSVAAEAYHLVAVSGLALLVLLFRRPRVGRGRAGTNGAGWAAA